MAYKKAAIDSTRPARGSRVKAVGIELEGAWKAVPAGVTLVDSITPGGDELGRDGSLRELRARLDVAKFPYVGELPSPPIKESELEAWMFSRYPDEVGPECGMHVHISLTSPLVYMWLMDDEAYPATVVEYLKRWATAEGIDKTDPIWNRLAGGCEFCQHEHWPSDQAKTLDKDYSKTRKGHRYTAIAFHYLRNGLSTIECRLLSMCKTKEQGLRGAREFISITNRYLVATAKREAKQVSNVIADQPAELTLNLTV